MTATENDFVYLKDVLAKWTGADLDMLIGFVNDTKELAAYMVTRRFIAKADNAKHYEITDAGRIVDDYRFEKGRRIRIVREGIDPDDYVFLNKDVADFEAKYPYLTDTFLDTDDATAEPSRDELAAENARLRERIKELEAAQNGAQGAEDKLDGRERSSLLKICAAILRYADKDISKPNVRSGIKKHLELSDKPAKKYFDMIQDIMNGKWE